MSPRGLRSEMKEHGDARLRVLLVGDFLPPVGGGMEQHLERLATALVERGHLVEVHVAGPRERNRASPFAVTVAGTVAGRLPVLFRDRDRPFPPPWPDPVFERSLARTIARFRPNIVHAHGWSVFSTAPVTRRRGIPLVVTLHDYGLLCPLRTLMRGTTQCTEGAGRGCASCPDETQGVIRRVALASGLRLARPRSVAAYIAVSEAVQNQYRVHGVEPVPVVIENFVAADDQAPSPVPADGPVLFVGSDAKVKGLDLLLRACRHSAWPSAREVRVVGVARIPDAPTWVRCFGRLDGETLWSHYRAASVVVVPSIWEEPGPLVAMEAMTFGRPVIGSEIGGMRRMIVSGVTGCLVPPGDALALGRAIDELMVSPARLRSMGEAARAAAAGFTVGAVVPRIERLYGDVLGRSASEGSPANPATP